MHEEKYFRFDKLHVFDAYHDLYWYNEIDHKHGGKIPGLTLPCKIVRHALKTLKDMKVISSTLKEKESNIKEESEKRYKNYMESIEHPPSTPGSGFSKLSDGVSNESVKRVQTELMKQIQGFSEIKESLRKTQNADNERFLKMEEILEKTQERFSEMEETLRSTQDAERERFSKMEETLRNCLQDSFQKSA